MSKKEAINRRHFLGRMAGGSLAALALNPSVGAASAQEGPGAAVAAPAQPESRAEVLTLERSGSDFMVDVLKSLKFEYVAANPGSSFRGLHESIINYGGNRAPELITCCHEESAVAMAHGYSKAEGRPMCVLLHSTVGLQHGAMAIYNAYCDRAPLYMMVGNTVDAAERRPGVEWNHSALDVAAMVRDYVKWDDLPASLAHFAESAVRGYKIAMTPPMMPVLLVADSSLQENPTAKDATSRIPKLALAAPPQGETAAVAEVARLLVAAENPVIVADRAARTPAGLARLIELAEALQAPVVNLGARMNFPTQHPLNHTDRSRNLLQEADVVLALEAQNLWGTLNSYRDQLRRSSEPIVKPGTKLISITSTDLYMKGNYQDVQRYAEVDLAIAADAEATLPLLIEEVKRQANADRRRVLQARGAQLTVAHQRGYDRARNEATLGWDASPISSSRLVAELWEQIKGEDWALVSDVEGVSRWPMRLWNFDKHYQFIGGAGGAGVGYATPAAVGAALAHRKHGRVSVGIVGDGDMMFAPGVLWTAAHHRIPLLTVVHNNRAYHQEVMHIQRMANRHERGVTSAGIGTTIIDPAIDYAKLAQSMGVHGEGPIETPQELGPAIRRALAVVKRGEPALIDVVAQPR